MIQLSKAYKASSNVLKGIVKLTQVKRNICNMQLCKKQLTNCHILWPRAAASICFVNTF